MNKQALIKGHLDDINVALYKLTGNSSDNGYLALTTYHALVQAKSTALLALASLPEEQPKTAVCEDGPNVSLESDAVCEIEDRPWKVEHILHMDRFECIDNKLILEVIGVFDYQSHIWVAYKWSDNSLGHTRPYGELLRMLDNGRYRKVVR